MPSLNRQINSYVFFTLRNFSHRELPEDMKYAISGRYFLTLMVTFSVENVRIFLFLKIYVLAFSSLFKPKRILWTK